MTSRTLRRDHAALLASLDLAIQQSSDPTLCEASDPTVSKWSVKDHLEHLAQANGRIVGWIERVRDGDPDLAAGGRPNLVGRVVLLVGGFPRGRGKAPEATLPQGCSAEELVARTRRVRDRVEALGDALPELRRADATLNHFAFGDLTAAQWLRFALIHNRHHQKIIRDVLEARS